MCSIYDLRRFKREIIKYFDRLIREDEIVFHGHPPSPSSSAATRFWRLLVVRSATYFTTGKLQGMRVHNLVGIKEHKFCVPYARFSVLFLFYIIHIRIYVYIIIRRSRFEYLFFFIFSTFIGYVRITDDFDSKHYRPHQYQSACIIKFMGPMPSDRNG